MPRTLRRSTARSSEPVNDVQPEETEEAPARGRSRGRRDAEPEAEERPAGRTRGRRSSSDENTAAPEIASGWGGYDENREEYGDYAPDFGKTLKEAQDDDRDVLVKFVDDAPFAVYRQHWIERKGKRSFNCIGAKCPLCNDAGDRPGTKAAFNVISLDDPDNPKVEVWTVGQRIADMIKKLSVDKKTSPLNREDLYFAISRTGKKGGSVQTNISPVKERDLEEDWDCEPLSAADLDEFDAAAYDKDSVEYLPANKLAEVADEIVG